MSASEALHVTTLGERGQPVVFCHGLFGQGRNWLQIGKQLASDHRVLLVDMPQHGLSPWADSFDYLDAADQVAGVLSAEEPAALVGHSMGGKIAMLLALRHPDLVERLCVVDVAPVGYQHGDEFVGYVEAMQGLDLAGLEWRSDADAALSEAVPNQGVRSFLLQNLRNDDGEWSWRLNLEVLGRDLERIAGWPEDALADVSPYSGPVLWVGGARSDYIRDDYAEAMDRLFPRNRRVSVKDAGHWVHSEKPAVFVEVLRGFLGRDVKDT